jgi:hypothetical protein
MIGQYSILQKQQLFGLALCTLFSLLPLCETFVTKTKNFVFLQRTFAVSILTHDDSQGRV